MCFMFELNFVNICLLIIVFGYFVVNLPRPDNSSIDLPRSDNSSIDLHRPDNSSIGTAQVLVTFFFVNKARGPRLRSARPGLAESISFRNVV